MLVDRCVPRDLSLANGFLAGCVPCVVQGLLECDPCPTGWTPAADGHCVACRFVGCMLSRHCLMKLTRRVSIGSEGKYAAPDGTCKQCPKGRFQAVAAQTSCTHCAIGASARLPLLPGLTCVSVNWPGSAAGELGSAECPKCAPTAIAPYTGLSSCTDCSDPNARQNVDQDCECLPRKPAACLPSSCCRPIDEGYAIWLQSSTMWAKASECSAR